MYIVVKYRERKNNRTKEMDGETKVALPFLTLSQVMRTLYSEGDVPNPLCWIVFPCTPIRTCTASMVRITFQVSNLLLMFFSQLSIWKESFNELISRLDPVSGKANNE